MIPYIIGLLLVVITLLIIGLILRKRVYDQVDRLETWKMDVINRNTAAELARIKGLNLSGETQEKFESWKNQWETIVTKELPEVEEWLFEAEDAADRYRFSLAKKIVHKIETTLTTVEKEIDEMLAELDNLLLSEKSSRKEIENLRPLVAELRQVLVQNDEAFGRGKHYFLAAVTEAEEAFATYEELAEAGNYLEARRLVDQLTLDLDVLHDQMDVYPDILVMCTETLPSKLTDLAVGLNEMKNDGFYIEHLGYEKAIVNYRARLRAALQSLEQGATSEVSSIAAEITDEIAEMYDKLEEEALARNGLEAQVTRFKTEFTALAADFVETQEEVEILQTSYFLEDHDLERFLQMEHTLQKINDQLDTVAQAMKDNKTSYVALLQEVEAGLKQVEETQEKHEAFKNKIRNLRKEELAAREKLTEMHRDVSDLHRELNKSNLPGVPTFIWTMLDDVEAQTNHVITTLEKEPLDMVEVKQALSEAEEAISRATEQIEMLLDQAFLTEQVIQYANRYRRTNPSLAARLAEAEALFRSYDYALSLERAAEAIEAVEPGALKKIEANQQEIL